ncbi:MAG: hypothetical protein K8T89_06080 [Planctomycetes bacterium]|nr:hypothetical protein [Planctomycetota bacterium]
MKKLRNVTLEMSPKPFYETTDAYIEKVCRHVFRQWGPLLMDADQVSVLMWTADGSEILTYKGNLDEEIEWARYIGGANPHWNVPGDPEGKAIHSRPYIYKENPAVITFRDLKRIVAAIKRIGHEMTGLPVRVGETFDPGCEFAKSPFKYKLHPEIMLADTGGPKSFTACYATFNEDHEVYAGFPKGIPQGTPMGTFLGRQAQHMMTDMGFDYIWFSNGFGYGLETWMTRGPLFDGRKFSPETGPEVREKILNFWKLFRKECPKLRIETRGTNLSTGIDLASDGVPLADIYSGDFNMEPPPNSPWAALNGDFGLELAGYMSHIAELPPGGKFPFRFYTHDPWWQNSPWLDRYGRESHDIYMPMSVGRINEKGETTTADQIDFLTIDDSHGKLPDQVPNEVIPHIQEGRRNKPDQPAPVIWVYPFAEYHQMMFAKSPRPDEMFFGDWYIRSAIKRGLPLNTVVSTTNFVKSIKSSPATYRGAVLVTTVPDAGTDVNRAVMDFVKQGGRVIFYGPIRHADPALLEMLNLRAESEISGELTVVLKTNVDELINEPYPGQSLHRTIINAGGIEAVIGKSGDAGTKELAAVTDSKGTTRTAAIVRRDPAWKGGAAAWVRGTSASDYIGGDLISGIGHLPTEDDGAKVFHAEVLMRMALAELGEEFSVKKRTPGQPDPITCIARHDNSFFFSGYVPDMTVEMRIKLRQGAPLFVGCEADLVNGRACYRMPRAWRRECRVFIEQESGVVTCYEKTAEMIGLKRRFRIVGLKNAKLRFYPEFEKRAISFVNNGSYPYFEGPHVKPKVCDDDLGKYLLAEDISGELVISW